jgi:hypothetical protein
MDEIKEVVNTEESATSEQDVVNTEEQETSTEETTTQETTEQTQEESKPQKQEFSPVDEKGVPWMNRFYESERKSRELLENLENKMGEILSQKTQTQPEYSISQLEEFAIANPVQRPWVEEQKSKIIEKNVAKIAQNEIKAVDEKRTAEQKRQNAYGYVTQAYPECFVRDNFGNLQWNNQSPLVQQISQIMNDSRFKNDPEGLVAAADMAYGRMARMQSGQNQKKVKSLQMNLKKVQKGTMIEGSGQQATKAVKDEFTKAKEKLLSSPGNKNAAQDVVKAYLKKAGVIEE